LSTFKTRFQEWYIGFSRRMRILSIFIIILLVGYVIYLGYDYYSKGGVVGQTANKAIEQYFGALSQGNYEEVYRLTAKENLTDIYGRRITEGEFISQLKKLTGDHALPFRNVEITKIYEHRNVAFYEAKLHSMVGNAAGVSRLIIEVRREDNVWVVTYPFAIMLQG